MLTYPEITKLGEKELKNELANSGLELAKLTFQIRNGNAKETHRVKQLKAHIARIKTFQTSESKSTKK